MCHCAQMESEESPAADPGMKGWDSVLCWRLKLKQKMSSRNCYGSTWEPIDLTEHIL